MNNENEYYDIEDDEYQKKIEFLYRVQANMIEDNEQLEEQTINLKNEVDRYKKELDFIKSSFGFKVMRIYGTIIDKIRGRSKIKKIGNTISTSSRVIKEEGFRSFVNQAKEKIQRGEFTVSVPDLEKHESAYQQLQQKLLYVESSEPKIYKEKFNVSEVILTNSSEVFLKPLINKLYLQKGINNFEIIIVNSGNHNLSSLEKMENLKVYNINPNEFNHGKTRGFGVEKTNQDYVVFISDDAIPISNHLFYDMCKSLQEDPKIAAVTGRQIVRSDSDLMYSYLLKSHYDYLNFERVLTWDNFEKLNPIQKRQIAQIEDVCACYKKEIFSIHKFRNIQYAEDLDLGIKLVKNGYRVVRLFSNGVIHSHNRSASYYLKRGFVDTTTLLNILGHETVPLQELKKQNLHLILIDAFNVYNSLGLVIDNLKKNALSNISKTFDTLSDKIKKLHSSKTKPQSCDRSLEEVFDKIHLPRNVNSSKGGIILKQYFQSLKNFKYFMNQTYPSLLNIDDEFYKTLYKIFGDVVGNTLGSYFFYISKKGLVDDELLKIKQTLSVGI